MMTETMSQVLEDTAGPAPRRRRRLLAVALAALVLAGSLGVFLVHLSVTGELLSGNGSTGRFPGEDVATDFDERDEVQVAYQHGGTYTFEFSLLRNESRWAVRVVDFPDVGGGGLLDPFDFAIGVTTQPIGPFVAFRLLSIGSGKEALVRVDARFSGCERYGAGTSSTLVSLPVRYQALWATRTHWIDLPQGIQVPAPETCPES